MKKLLLFFTLISFILSAQNQTDSLDLSENPVQFALNKKIRETSGIEYYNGCLYTINDSGNKPEVYKLNAENGEIIQTIKVKGAVNIDWEEITRKGDTLFIGDFGNNLGVRKDLTIYSIILPKNNLTITEAEIINKIEFSFEDQDDFSKKNYKNNNFDCEAFVYYNGKLHLFSKRWGDYSTTHYTLNTTDKIQIARKVENIYTNCVITGASIFDEKLYMTGYTRDGLAYIWKFTDFSDNYFFNGNSKKTLIGLTAIISQIEGISVTKDKIYITGEEMNYSLFHTEPMLYIVNPAELNN